MELDGFRQIGTRGLHVFPLRGDAKFQRTRHVPMLFFSDEGRESLGQRVMLRLASV